MVAVSVGVSAREAGDQNIGTEGADYANHVGEGDIVAAPLLKSFFRGLRISEIGDAGEALLDSVVTVGGQKLERAQDSKFVEQTGAEFVLSAFAASEGEKECLHAFAPGFEGEGCAIFVVGMGNHHHQTPGV